MAQRGSWQDQRRQLFDIWEFYCDVTIEGCVSPLPYIHLTIFCGIKPNRDNWPSSAWGPARHLRRFCTEDRCSRHRYERTASGENRHEIPTHPANLGTEHISNRESNISITVHTQFIALSLAQFLSDLWLRYYRDHGPCAQVK